MSGHVLERDTQVAALLIHLRLRLADVEHTSADAASTAAHATHEEDPQCHDDEDGHEVIEDHVQEVIVLMILIHEVTRKDLVVLCLVDKLLQLVNRTELHLYIGILTRLLGALMEHVSDVLRFYVHLDDALGLVDHDL